MTTAFNPSAYGKPNPEWTKRKLGRGNTLNALADHICTRTPPFAFDYKASLFITIVRRNQRAIGGWHQGYEILTDKVWSRLVERDGLQ